MNQIVHIFKKDARHHWIELAISLALVANIVWVGPVAWKVQGPFLSPFDPIARTIVQLVMPLILISWFLLVARVIQSEVLVGDRQFWITRPYEWKKLMTAKMLFLAVFLYMPLLMMQALLLARAGFSPLHWLPHLLLNLVFFSAMVLSVAALACVTPNIGRILMVLLGVAVCLFVLFAGANLGGGGMGITMGDPSRPLASYLVVAIALALGGAVIVMQYRARRTKLAWAILLLIPAAFAAIQLISPDRLFVNHSYPPISNASGAPVQLAFNDVSGDHSLGVHETRSVDVARRLALIQIPIRLSGVSDGTAIVIDEASLSFEAPNGAHWTSKWEGLSYLALRSENGIWTARIMVPAKVFEEFEGAPVNLRLNAAITELKADSVTTINMPKPTDEIAVPGFGICAPEPSLQADARTLSCRFPWKPPFAYVSTRWFNESCASAKSGNDPGVEGDAWVGSDDSTRGWEFVPVLPQEIKLSNSMAYAQGHPEMRYLCPDAPATFTSYEQVRRVQEGVAIPNMHLFTAPEQY